MYYFHSLINSFSKDFGSYTNHGRALLYGDRVIVAHAHGEFAKLRIINEESCFHSVENLFGKTEFTSYLLRIVGKRSHHHESTNAYILIVSPLTFFQHLYKRFFRESPFRLFLGDVELQQTVDGASHLLALLIDFFQQFRSIYSVNERNERGDVFHFVCLQMSCHVPLNVLRENRLLFHKLLHMVFAKDALSRIVCFLNGFYWMVFGNSHKPTSFR